jgi:hypothetical protein
VWHNPWDTVHPYNDFCNNQTYIKHSLGSSH